MVEALVACQVPGYPDPVVEKTFAVHQPHAACRDVTKKSFDEGYTYVNKHGCLILEKLRTLEEEQKRHSKWMLTMEPLRETAVAVRLRFWHHFVKSIGNDVNSPDTISTTSSDRNDVPTGNRAAHEGNFLTNSALFSQGYLTDTSTFHILYGVPLLNCEQYFSKFTNPFMKIILTNSIESKRMVEMFDKRASMLANPSRYTREWAAPEQADFDTVLAFFRTADEENRRKLEVGEVAGPPAAAVTRRAWPVFSVVQSVRLRSRTGRTTADSPSFLGC